MIISKSCASYQELQHRLTNTTALMVVKGGDVQQLIETPYAQPYIQIVSSIAATLRDIELLTGICCSFTMSRRASPRALP
jgi:hypothetical protein